MIPAPLFRCLVLLVAGGLASCGGIDNLFHSKDADVVYALGSRDAFTAPLQGALKPACPALEFTDNHFRLTGVHDRTLKELTEKWKDNKSRFLIAGYASPSVTEDYARSLTERRAQAVRQRLIENGIEASRLQTVGYGRDMASSSPTSNVVVIYTQP